MEYDKKMLEEWCRMEDWGSYLDRNGALNKFSSQEGFQFLQREYFSEVKRRIDYCKNLLKYHEDAFLCYTLGELCDRLNEDESPAYLYKRPVRYYCLKALEIDPDFAPAKNLLKKIKAWIEFIGGDDGEDIMPELNVEVSRGRKNSV
ncbi:MAG: hypothetical protein P9X22_08830 [Candidatus Zapsychrus exili]|nr:hypothetical protein [Candidatus Zapsychrus exili]